MGSGGSSETRKERVDRELIELLNELRVTLPGVQVLFAFLFTVPFSDRFADLTDPQRAMFFGTFATTAAASILLMAPASYHRVRFREGDKEQMLRAANRFAIGGTVLLAVAMAGATALLSDLLYGTTLAVWTTASLVAAVSWCWFGSPLLRSWRDRAPA